MPRIPIPLVRPGGFREAEKMFVLSYEGTVTEKKYFEDFRQSTLFNDSGLIEVISLKRPSHTGSDPISVKRLLQQAKEDYNFKPTDEFWLIIDRDDWEEVHHHDFDRLAESCRQEGNFYLAMSNPCFELWLLLHLQDLNDYDTATRHKLLQNPKVSRSKNFIDQLLSDLQGRGYNKRPNPQIFLPLTRTALRRAQELDDPPMAYPRQLGTHVYRLIQKLIAPA